MNRKNSTFNTARTAVTAFGKEEHGQDLVEYSLLVSFLALAGASLLASVGTTVKGVLTNVNTGVSLARNAAS